MSLPKSRPTLFRIAYKTLRVIFMIAFIGVIGVVGYFWVSIGDFCRITIREQITSPDGLVVATEFERDCGVLGSGSTIVSIHPPSWNKSGGNDRDFWVFQAMPGDEVEIVWTGNRALLITHIFPERKKTVSLQVVKLGQVSIQYMDKIQ